MAALDRRKRSSASAPVDSDNEIHHPHSSEIVIGSSSHAIPLRCPISSPVASVCHRSHQDAELRLLHDGQRGPASSIQVMGAPRGAPAGPGTTGTRPASCRSRSAPASALCGPPDARLATRLGVGSAKLCGQVWDADPNGAGGSATAAAVASRSGSDSVVAMDRCPRRPVRIAAEPGAGASTCPIQHRGMATAMHPWQSTHPPGVHRLALRSQGGRYWIFLQVALTWWYVTGKPNGPMLGLPVTVTSS